MCSIMATQCSGDVHLSTNDPSEFIQIHQLILIKFDTCMNRISRRVSFKPFLPTCFRYQIHSGIEHSHDLGTTKNR